MTAVTIESGLAMMVVAAVGSYYCVELIFRLRERARVRREERIAGANFKDCLGCLAYVPDIDDICPHCECVISTGAPVKPKISAFSALVLAPAYLGVTYIIFAGMYFSFCHPKLTTTQVFIKIFTWYLE